MAQRRRQEQQMKQRQNIITALCIAAGLGAMLLSVFICILIFDPFAASTPVSAPSKNSSGSAITPITTLRIRAALSRL